MTPDPTMDHDEVAGDKKAPINIESQIDDEDRAAQSERKTRL